MEWMLWIHKQDKNFIVYFGYPVLLSTGMGDVKSPNPNGCWLLKMEWMQWIHTQYKNLTVYFGYQNCWVMGCMLWSYLTSWMPRSTRATRRTKASAWSCCCCHCCSTTHGNRVTTAGCELVTLFLSHSIHSITKSYHPWVLGNSTPMLLTRASIH